MDEVVIVKNKTKSKTLDKKKYYAEYYNNKKSELQQKVVCPDCGHEYKRYNRSSHILTQKHKDGITIIKLMKQVNNLNKVSEN